MAKGWLVEKWIEFFADEGDARTAMMDIKTLKVGQQVRMDGKTQSWFHQGTVTKVTDHGVEVLENESSPDPMWFDSDGKRMWFGSNGPEQELEPIPDFTKTLKVGQMIWLVSHFWGCQAQVLEITPTNIIVKEMSKSPSNKIRFDINGRAMDSRDLGYPDTGCCYSNIPGTDDGGPWYIA